MKRIRDDPNEYLGGDLSSDLSFVDTEDGDEQRPATKAERNAKRRQANKEWKVSDRLVDSGKDPNPRHTLYYKQQLPCLLTEWNKFQEALCSPLPVTFRFGGGCPKIVEDSIKKRVADEFRTMRGRYVELNGSVLTDNIVKPISWCKSYQIAADSGTLARSEALAPLYDLLCREVSLGNVVRQELASMIPVLLLDVQHNHTVLDVCAAPGSKTEQILAAMQHDGERKGLGTICSGMVVANDADPKRILTLKKRYSRCGRPNLLINCSRAEDLYRSIKGKFKFDRIVADVPCSGDGTFRKFSHLWRLFRPRVSLELHLIQLQIAKASALMLKSGGRMVYSTCSINPLEDEAVVAALLLYCNGKLTLVDIEKENLLPGLIKRKGISNWHCDEDIFTIGEPDDSARLASKSRLTQLCPSMYPPTEEIASQLHLNRCVRILPHDQDTGGFFVAVLEMVKTGDIPVPYKISTILKSDVIMSTDMEKVNKIEEKIVINEKKEKKISIGISEARTLQTFKSLGFNAKSRQKEKIKKDNKSKGKNEIKDKINIKMDTTRCELYKSLGSDFLSAGTALHFNDLELCDGLTDMSVMDSTDITSLIIINDISSSSSSSSSSTSSSSCCLIIATSVTIPDIIEKKGLDEDVMLSKAEEEKLKIKKLEQKSRDSNGIFGSRSTGWLKVESKETEEMKIGPYKKVQLVSKCVENALQTWARKDMIIQAGVTVCNYQESSGTWTLEPDGARAFLPHIKNENVIVLPGSDFAFFLRIGCEENEDGEGIKSSVIMYQDSDSKKEGEVEVEDDVSIGVEVERSNGDIFHIETAISSHSKKTLWKYCVERLELLESSSSSFSLIIVVDDVIDNNIHKIDKNIILSEGNQIFKRRLSKAEKKNLKSNSKILRPSNSDQNNINNDSKVQIDSESTEHKMVLVLTVSYNIVDNSYEGVRLNTATSADVCNSYMTAMYSLKL